MKTLFENRRQARKVRIILWFAMVLAVIALYSGWTIFTSYGLSPADGGQLKPFGTRLAFGSAISLAGILFCAAMMIYATLYLLSLHKDGEDISVTTLTWIGTRSRKTTFKEKEFKEATYNSGRLNLEISVDAPWMNLYVAGRRLPFILDLKAETIKQAELSRLCHS